MYFLVNENMPSSVVVGLRAAGHDVLYAIGTRSRADCYENVGSSDDQY